MSLMSMFKRGAKLAFATLCLICLHGMVLADLSTLERNDPYPVYTAIDPQEFLYTWQKLHEKGIPTENPPIPMDGCQFMGLSISPFGQNACGGKNFCGQQVPLGDLNGRWNMIGLLMGPLPQGRTQFPEPLQTAFTNLFGNCSPSVTPGNLNDPNLIDPNQTFGFFSVPLKYHKRGLRWQFSAMLYCDMGFMLQGGVADICQKVVGFDNLTCISCSAPVPCNGPAPSGTATGTPKAITPCNCDGTPITYTNQNSLVVPVQCCPRVCDTSIPCCGRIYNDNGTSAATGYPCLTATSANKYLMNELKPIAEAIGLNICDFHKTAIEDLRFYLFWRRAHVVNKGRAGWPEFLFIPYLMFGGSVPTGPDRNSNCAFALPFGNNGHGSMGASGGFNIDFTETIEVGFDFGITGFFPRNFCNYRVPNQVPNKKCQVAISPFTTNVRICPGFNWTFGAKLFAYQFLDRLSFWGQYMLLHHEQDKVSLQTPDPAFAPEILEEMSSFKVQMANLGFYYDISPNISLGFFWQAPLNQRNAYKSTTVMFTLFGTW